MEPNNLSSQPSIDQSIINSFHTCIEMLEMRNYTIVETKSPVQFLERDQETLFIEAIKPNKMKVQVYICQEQKLNMDIIKYYYNVLKKNKIKHGIIIYLNNITSRVKYILANMDIKIELFKVDELQFNIMKHRLVPKHTKVDVKSNNIEKYKHYPVLKKSEPVAKIMGFNIGDIIEIERKNGEIYMRRVD